MAPSCISILPVVGFKTKKLIQPISEFISEFPTEFYGSNIWTPIPIFKCSPYDLKNWIKFTEKRKWKHQNRSKNWILLEILHRISVRKCFLGRISSWIRFFDPFCCFHLRFSFNLIHFSKVVPFFRPKRPRCFRIWAYF